LSGNTVRPVLHAESSGFLPSSLGWAWATPAVTPRQKTTRAKRIINPSNIPFTEHPRGEKGGRTLSKQIKESPVEGAFFFSI